MERTLPRPLAVRIPMERIAVGLGLAAFAVACLVLFIHAPGGQTDTMAYWNAALRLREGAELYPPLADHGAGDVYRYAPWFAVLWVPATYLPLDSVLVGWFALLLVAGVASLAWLLRHGPSGLILACLMAFPTVQGILSGNAQILMHFAFIWLVGTRWSGATIGVLASMKAFPLVLLLVHVRRGEWKQVVIGTAVVAVLVAPMLLSDLSHYPTTPAQSDISLWTRIPWLAAVLAVLALALTWLYGKTRYGWMFGGLAIIATAPQSWGMYTPLMLTGLKVGATQAARSRASRT